MSKPVTYLHETCLSALLQGQPQLSKYGIRRFVPIQPFQRDVNSYQTVPEIEFVTITTYF